jgi:hypothetical protein
MIPDRTASRRRRLPVAALILLVTASVGGCGGSEESGGAGGAPAATGAPASTANATKDVSVTLAKLASYFPNSGTAPFWITVDQGQVTKIARQFLP